MMAGNGVVVGGEEDYRISTITTEGGEAILSSTTTATTSSSNKLLVNSNNNSTENVNNLENDRQQQQLTLTPAELQTYLAYTLVMCRKFREQPLLSCDAQVFMLDAKRNWEELSSHPVPVHIYFDSTRQTYRLICVDLAKPLINSTITTSIVVTKTSKKFAQWLDSHAKLVYGLGFMVEVELDNFITKVKELQNQVRLQSTSNAGIADVVLDRSTSLLQAPNTSNLDLDTSGRGLAVADTDTSHISADTSSYIEHQSPQKELELLKKENDKLKAALTQSGLHITQWKEKMDRLEKQNQTLRESLFNDTKEEMNVSSAGANAMMMGASRRALNTSTDASAVPRSLSVDSAREAVTNDNLSNDAMIVMANKIKEVADQNKVLQNRLMRAEVDVQSCQGKLMTSLNAVSTARTVLENSLQALLEIERTLTNECQRFNC